MNHMTPTGQGLLLTPDDVLALVRLIGAARDAHTSIEADASWGPAATDRADELRNAITAAERALGLPPADGWKGDRDPDGEPLRWENHYECDCGEKWEDIWSCACNDRCPACDTECQPVRSVDLMCDAPADQS